MVLLDIDIIALVL